MQMFVITPSGARVAFDEFGAFTLGKLAENDPGALRTLRHARESSDVTGYPDVQALADALLAAPEQIGRLVAEADDVALSRFAAAMAQAYAARTPEASLAMGPETQEDRDFLASFQAPPKVVQ